MRRKTYRAPEQKYLISRFWRSAYGFWRGSSAWVSWPLIALMIGVVVLQLVVQYWLNFWNRDFFNALEQKDGTALLAEALIFLPLATASTVLTILSVWGRMTVQRKWREWLSKHMVDYWLTNGRYRRLKFMRGEHRNPEYRIAEDARVATDSPIDLGLGLLTSLLTAITFIGILWSIGGDLVFDVFGVTWTLPGYLVIAVIIYSGLFTAAMVIIGRHLTHVIEGKNQAEAELRSVAAHLRESGEGTALSNGEPAERRALGSAFAQLIAQWRQLCRQLMRTTFVGHVNFLFAPVFAWIICTPKYLTGGMPLGEMAQVAAAFVAVQAALNWLVDNYQRLADWTSSVNRVSSLLIALDQIDRDEYPWNQAIITVETQDTLAQCRETVTVIGRGVDQGSPSGWHPDQVGIGRPLSSLLRARAMSAPGEGITRNQRNNPVQGNSSGTLLHHQLPLVDRSTAYNTSAALRGVAGASENETGLPSPWLSPNRCGR